MAFIVVFLYFITFQCNVNVKTSQRCRPLSVDETVVRTNPPMNFFIFVSQEEEEEEANRFVFQNEYFLS